MSKKNVRLLSSCIVSALHVNEAQKEGTVFNPEDFGKAGVDEANYLVLTKIAERTDDPVNYDGKTLDSEKSQHISGVVVNDDAVLKTVLNGSVAEVQEAIDSGVYDAKQINRLGELNTLSEKPRAGVAAAVEKYLADNAAE